MNLNHEKRLKFIRKEKDGLTQQQLADLIDIPVHKIKSIETNKAKISTDIALLIEEKLNFSFKWILTGEGPIYKDGAKKEVINEKEQPSSNITQVIIEHQDMIREFQDPDKAMEFNQFLVEIEKHDPEGYDELYREARAIYKTLKRIQQKEALKKTSDKDDLQNGTSA